MKALRPGRDETPAEEEAEENEKEENEGLPLAPTFSPKESRQDFIAPAQPNSTIADKPLLSAAVSFG